MALYMYTVTKDKVCLSNGEMANVARFAYKPHAYFWGDRVSSNARMHFRTGCVANDYAAEKGHRSSWVVMGDTTVLYFPKPVGSFTDDDETLRHVIKNVYVDLSHAA